MSSTQSNATEKKPVFSGRLTLKAVNTALAEAGSSEILVRGHGFHYFAQGSPARWPTCLVMKPRLADYTLEQWVIVWRNMLDILPHLDLLVAALRRKGRGFPTASSCLRGLLASMGSCC